MLSVSVIIDDEKKLGITSADCNIQITDLVADVSYKINYVNDLAKPSNASATLPVRQNSAVYSFEAYIGEKLVRAKCMEKKQAKERYNEAVKQGKFAYHGFYKADDLLSLNVGNIAPGDSVSVGIRYIIQLDYNDATGVFSFNLPMTIVPRYNPSNSDKRTPIENPPFLGINGKIRSVNSSIEDYYGNVGEISFTREDPQLVTFDVNFDPLHVVDLWVYLKYSNPCIFRAVVEKGTDSNILLLIHRPSFVEKKMTEIQQEFVFLLDRSCSMSGTSIKRAAEALKIALMSLPSKALFNIIGFGSTFSSLFKGSVPIVDAKKKREALRHIAHVKADLGGTEILEPIRRVLKREVRPGYSRKIIIITDGAVSNYEEVIHEVAQSSATNRVFVIGIGSGSSSVLIEGMSSAGNGSFEYVDDNATEIDEKVIKVMTDATKSVIINPSIKLPGKCFSSHFPIERKVYVNNIPHLLFYVFDDSSQFDGLETVSLQYSGLIEGTHYEETLDVPLFVMDKASRLLHRFATKDYFQRIMHHFTDKEFEADKDKIKSSALKWSLSSNIVSRVTSFVGVDENEDALTYSESCVSPFHSRIMAYSAKSALVASCGAKIMRMSRGPNCLVDQDASDCDALLDSPTMSLTTEADSVLPMDILDLQRADGLFEADDEFLVENKYVDKDEFDELCAEYNVSRDKFFTVVCVVILEKLFREKANVLSLIIRKAIDGLEMDADTLAELRGKISFIVKGGV